MYLIDAAALFGSVSCFNYFIEQNCEIHRTSAIEYSMVSAKKDIISTIISITQNVDEVLEASVKYHKYELTDYLFKNYKCNPVNLSTCLKFLNYEAFFYFLNRGSSLNDVDSYGNSIIYNCADQGFLHILQYIVGLGVDVNIKSGIPPILVACEYNFIHIVNYLLEKGADIEARDSHGKSCLHIACEKEFLQLAQFLIEKGADLNPKDTTGKTPLMYACYHIFIPFVHLLVESDANTEATDLTGSTVVMQACSNGAIPIIQYLADNGANLNAQNNKGQTPLHIAVQTNRTSVVKFLLEKGVNKHIKDINGAEPIDIATNEEIKDLLKDSESCCLLG